ncbi:MAG: hypothetical protein ACLPID_00155 [Beijerinckiaceae bacterium]
MLIGIGVAPIGAWQSLDHDDFGLIQSKIMNVIDSNSLERDAGGKPVPTFPHPALALTVSTNEPIIRSSIRGANVSQQSRGLGAACCTIEPGLRDELNGGERHGQVSL